MASCPVTWACEASNWDWVLSAWLSVAGLAGQVGLVMCLLLLQRRLIGLQRPSGGCQLIEIGGDVPDGDAGVLTCRLDPLLTSGEDRGVRARGPGPVVGVGPDRLVADIAGPLADLPLVLLDLLTQLGDALGVGGDRRRGHRVLLLIGTDLQLLLDQALRERGRLRSQIGDLIGPHGSGNEDLREGGRGDESREKHGRHDEPAAHSCV